jgi:3-keto-5-aminohexanoate cleavage enzyme
MASLTPSSLNFNNQASITTPEMVQKLAQKMKDLGVKPELEAFDIGMINYAKYLHKKELIDPPFFFTFILGNVACAQANILNLAVMKNELPDNSYFVVGGVGDPQLHMNVEGLLNTDGVRVGLEDMYYWSAKRERLCTNIELLERIKTIMDILEVEAATPQEVREMLELGSNRLVQAIY